MYVCISECVRTHGPNNFLFGVCCGDVRRTKLFCQRRGKELIVEFSRLCTKAYLGPCQTSTMEVFCKNNQGLKVVKIFQKKDPPEIFDMVLNMSLVYDFLGNLVLYDWKVRILLYMTGKYECSAQNNQIFKELAESTSNIR